MKALMKTGDFAQLCRTTKETLRHYDQLGLLRPVGRAKNGYKLYSFTQYVDYLLISALQSTGLSLAAIRDFLMDSSSARLYEVLDTQIEVIEQQQRELEQKRQMLEGALKQVQTLQDWFSDERVKRSKSGYLWRIVYCPQEYFLETAVPYSEDHEEDFLSSVTEHMEYCERNGWTVSFQEAYRIDEAHVCARSYAEGFCAEVRIPEAIESSRLRVKPAGRYLQWLNKIELAPYMESYDEALLRELANQPLDAEESSVSNPMFDAYDAMLSFVQEQELSLVGDLYDVVLSLYGGNYSDAIYTEVSMRISD